jgi:anti-sigma B factor antagonist
MNLQQRSFEAKIVSARLVMGGQAMEVSTHQLKHCDLVKATGHIDNHTAPQLDEAFEAINQDGRYKIVFDMSGVEYISSAGLRVLIKVQKTCKHWKRGELILAGATEQIRKTLGLAGLLSIFRFFDHVEEAVGSF